MAEADAALSVMQSALVELREAVLEATLGQGVAVAVEIRTPHVERGGVAAIVGAVSGMVQSFTMESHWSVPPVNVLITYESQHHDRDLTLAYLADPDSAIARGATFDLRETGR